MAPAGRKGGHSFCGKRKLSFYGKNWLVLLYLSIYLFIYLSIDFPPRRPNQINRINRYSNKVDAHVCTSMGVPMTETSMHVRVGDAESSRVIPEAYGFSKIFIDAHGFSWRSMYFYVYFIGCHRDGMNLSWHLDKCAQVCTDFQGFFCTFMDSRGSKSTLGIPWGPPVVLLGGLWGGVWSDLWRSLSLTNSPGTCISCKFVKNTP